MYGAPMLTPAVCLHAGQTKLPGFALPGFAFVSAAGVSIVGMSVSGISVVSEAAVSWFLFFDIIGSSKKGLRVNSNNG